MFWGVDSLDYFLADDGFDLNWFNWLLEFQNSMVDGTIDSNVITLMI